MAEKKKPTGDYEVGYCRPPAEYQFPKGKSGNPGGAPTKQKKKRADITDVLNEPVKVTVGGKERTMSPFEAGTRKLAKKAVDGHVPSILKFVKLCEEYGIIAPPPDASGGCVIFAPAGVDFHEWLERVTEWVADDEA